MTKTKKEGPRYLRWIITVLISILLSISLGFAGWVVSHIEKINKFPTTYVRAEEHGELHKEQVHEIDKTIKNAIVEQRTEMRELHSEMKEQRTEMRENFKDIQNNLYKLFEKLPKSDDDVN